MRANASTETLVSLFCHRAAVDADRTAFLYPVGGKFQELTWGQLQERAGQVALRLARLGVQKGDRVVQVADNSLEWLICDLGIMMAGGVHVPLHSMLSGPQILEQILDGGAKIVLLSDDQQAKKLRKLAAQIPQDVQLWTQQRCSWWLRRCLPLQEFFGNEPAGSRADVARLQQDTLSSLGPEDLATIMYTSGTTGEPRGVMLSHGNLVFDTQGTLEAFGSLEEELRLSFLPWSHIFARTCDLYTWIASGSRLAMVESREKIIDNCADLKPTLINAVPYFYEKIYRGAAAKGALEKPRVARRVLGGRIRLCCSGGAALPVHVAEWFQRQDVTLIEGYGLTETSPVITMCTPEAHKIGSVGRPLSGVEVRIADDGEILTRGPHVMQGYYNRPQATAETIRDGWLYTGDLGELDDEGFLRITGRKKEIIVLATGKNVAPAAVESRLTRDPLIIQAVVIGDQRNYLVALIVPDPDALKAEISRRGIRVYTRHQALNHPEVLDLYEGLIQQQLATLSSIEQVAKFKLLDRGFTVETGEMTPTLKLRRDLISANFAKVIDDMYTDISA
jgi:long-chain acyl-CoA synthetase